MTQRNASKITTELEVDDPLIQNAGFSFDKDDRQYLDNQIRGVEKHLVDALIRGRHATYAKIASTSAQLAPGDIVCLASVHEGEPKITKATPEALALALTTFGIMLHVGVPGAFGLVVFGGVLPPEITGLAPGAPGFVRVDTTTARCERVVVYQVGDYGVGTVDNAGWLHVIPGHGASATGSAVASAENIGSGADVFKQLAAGLLQLRRIRGAGGISVVVNGDSIDVDGSELGGLALPEGDEDDLLGLDGDDGLKNLGKRVVVYDDAAPITGVTPTNIRTTRPQRSAMDNSRRGIVNLGSDSTQSEQGATKDYAVLFGNRCSSTGVGAVCGGHFNVASGAQSLCWGDSCVASGAQSTALGTQNQASGAQSTALGSNNIASNQSAVAIGNANHAHGNQSIAMGSASIVDNVQAGVAIGFHNQCHAPFAVAIGTATQNWGPGSTTLGEDTVNTSTRCLTAGEFCEAHATGATAFGGSNRANGGWSFAHGSGAITSLPTQRTLSGGSFHNINSAVGSGHAQTSEIVMRGRTPGLAPSETVALRFGESGTSVLRCKPHRAYTFRVSATVAGIRVAEGDRGTATIRYTITARSNATALTIVNVHLDLHTGLEDTNPVAHDWSLSFGATDLDVGVSFHTGATAAKCAVVARVEFDEVIYFLDDPLQIPGCTLWLDASQGVTDAGGGAVSAWADQSASAKTFSQGTGANRPALVSGAYNGLPCIRFDGVNDFLSMSAGTLADLITAADHTVFVVAKWDGELADLSASLPTPQVLPAAITDTHGYWGLAQVTSYQIREFVSDGVSQYKTAAGSLVAALPIAAGFLRSTYDSPIEQALRLEVEAAHTAINKCGSVRALTGGVRVGSNYNGSAFFKGDVCEIVVYHRALSDEERQHVYQYLHDKWTEAA